LRRPKRSKNEVVAPEGEEEEEEEKKKKKKKKEKKKEKEEEKKKSSIKLKRTLICERIFIIFFCEERTLEVCPSILDVLCIL
jgi:hypothetical protein